ncbi:MAG: ribonuclease D, partial [Gemmataceae bacterium]
LVGCERFGIDTEFVGEQSYHPHLCLVQVAAPDRLFLIDPFSVGPLDPFWELVTDPTREVIVHAGREEVRLCKLWSGRAPTRLVDLQIAAGLAGYLYPLGHASLVNQVLGKNLAKGETLTEWRDRPLTRAQIRYALDDVRYLLPCWQVLGKRLDDRNRMDWAREEFDRLAGHFEPDEPGEPEVERWRKLRGLGSLDRRKLALVRALHRWREETAEKKNRPARAICRDDLLVEIAKRNPSKERDLHVVRGLPRRDLAEILKVVEDARALPIDQCPRVLEREQDPPQVAMLTGILNAVLGDWSARQHIASNIVATSTDLKLLVRAKMAGKNLGDESLLTTGWRKQHVLPLLDDILEGRRTVRVANPRGDAPLDVSD